MRTKEEILQTVSVVSRQIPALIEVLLDIRDILSTNPSPKKL